MKLRPCMFICLGAVLLAIATMASGQPMPGAQPTPAEPTESTASDPAPEVQVEPTMPMDDSETSTTEPATTNATTRVTTGPATSPGSNSGKHHLTRYPHRVPATLPGREPSHIEKQSGAQGVDLPSEFAILNERSIFARDKKPANNTSRPSDLGEPSTNAAEPRATEVTILTGVLQTDPADPGPDTYIAVVEDAQTNKRQALHLGDALDGGHVADMTLDYIDFELAGRRQRVRIGQNLEGATAAVPVTTAPAAEGSATGAAPTAAELLERLRQRRLREK